MEDTRKEMERIQRGLLTEEEAAMSLDEILADEELNALLNGPTKPAFDDPEKIHDPEKPLVYNNFANDYGAPKAAESKKKREDKVLIGLMITASALSLGIIGILSYWLTVLL